MKEVVAEVKEAEKKPEGAGRDNEPKDRREFTIFGLYVLQVRRRRNEQEEPVLHSRRPSCLFTPACLPLSSLNSFRSRKVTSNKTYHADFWGHTFDKCNDHNSAVSRSTCKAPESCCSDCTNVSL